MNDSTLFIDIGNTQIKWLQGDEYNFSLVEDFDSSKLPIADEVWVSDVTGSAFLNHLSNVNFAKVQPRYKQLINGYENFFALGIDRWLSMMAGTHRYPNQNILIIDAGSAITFDLVGANGHHQGGLIMPGLATLRRSFTQFATENSTLGSADLAKNTEDAWQSGTAKMYTDTIGARVDALSKKHKDLQILFAGGDGQKILDATDISGDYQPFLVLEGLSYYAQSMR